MKKAYTAPKATSLGDIRNLTKGAGSQWRYDGGLDYFSSEPTPTS